MFLTANIRPLLCDVLQSTLLLSGESSVFTFLYTIQQFCKSWLFDPCCALQGKELLGLEVKNIFYFKIIINGIV